MSDDFEEDPLVRHSRMEAAVAGLIWLAFMTSVVGISFALGSGRKPADVTYVFGVPDWVFFGVVIPWVVGVGVSYWYAFTFVRDESIGEDPGASPDAFAGAGEGARDA